MAALPVLALGGRDGQPHLLADGPGQEPAQGMRQPASRFEQFLGGYSAGPLQQIEDRRCLAAVPGTGGFLSAFGRFLGWGSLLPRLGLGGRNGRATCANSGLFRGLRLGRRSARRCFRLLCDRFHVFSLGGDYRVTTSITQKALESKRNQPWRMLGDPQMSAGERR